ncbi:hypothetical protein BD414DRAFT_118143 [Trametes punicea]|nr:hypothetical protein BD414DRAFT_118143 [Trametes punicea]
MYMMNTPFSLLVFLFTHPPSPSLRSPLPPSSVLLAHLSLPTPPSMRRSMFPISLSLFRCFRCRFLVSRPCLSLSNTIWCICLDLRRSKPLNLWSSSTK